MQSKVNNKMSYLLTEIALEMLGYKFHDIDGVCKKMNFRKAEAPEDIIPEEKLEIILGMTEDGEIENDNHVESNVNTKNDVGEASNSGSSKTTSANSKDPRVAQIRVAAFASKHPASSKSSTTNNVSQSIPFLASMLNYEAGRIKQRLKNRQTMENAKSSMDENQLCSEAIDILKEDLKQMKEFRCQIEQELNVFNPDIYKRYSSIFMQKKFDQSN